MWFGAEEHRRAAGVGCGGGLSAESAGGGELRHGESWRTPTPVAAGCRGAVGVAGVQTGGGSFRPADLLAGVPGHVAARRQCLQRAHRQESESAAADAHARRRNAGARHLAGESARARAGDVAGNHAQKPPGPDVPRARGPGVQADHHQRHGRAAPGDLRGAHATGVRGGVRGGAAEDARRGGGGGDRTGRSDRQRVCERAGGQQHTAAIPAGHRARLSRGGRGGRVDRPPGAGRAHGAAGRQEPSGGQQRDRFPHRRADGFPTRIRRRRRGGARTDHARGGAGTTRTGR
eukprot:ctg_2398.g372